MGLVAGRSGLAGERCDEMPNWITYALQSGRLARGVVLGGLAVMPRGESALQDLYAYAPALAASRAKPGSAVARFEPSSGPVQQESAQCCA
jgi:hypothetical protein